jgi:hypothetical protein
VIVKRYSKHNLPTYLKKRKSVADRHFKLDVKKQIFMLFVYHHLYMTVVLADFLFNLDQQHLQGYTKE